MNKENVKIGETYYTPAKVIGIGQNGNTFVRVLNHDIFCSPKGLRPIPSDPPTLVGTTPKHNPCRRFRKGDKVEYHPKDGRELFEAKRLLAQTLTVVENEHKEYNRVAVKAQNGYVLSVPFYYLELVTPIEELEPYSVETCQYGYTVNKGELILATYNDETHPHAKEAAEAERARLNAEYRKEQV